MPTAEALALAFGAGLVAAVNPCGFALLPAYLSLFVLDEQPSKVVAVGRAVKATAALTLGFAAVFLAFGLAIAPVAAGVQAYIPFLTVVIGLVVAAAGGWVLAGRKLPSFRLGRRSSDKVAPTARFGSMATFGASYAIASLTCTIAPFLAVVVTSFRAEDPVAGVVLFAVYAGAMGLLVGIAAIAVALARTSLLTRARAAGTWLPRIGGTLLVVAGLYVTWYGIWDLRVLHAGAGADPIISAAEGLQQWLAAAAPWAVGLGLLLLAGVAVFAVLALVRGRPRRAADRDHADRIRQEQR